MEDILVSVLMAVKDEAMYIQEALESVLGQTHRNLEVIVIDDHSTDTTFAQVEELAAADKRIVLQRAVGTGKVSAFNQAWRASSGDVIVLFAGDDILPADSVANRVRLLVEGGKDVSTGRVRSFSENPKYNGLILPRNGPSLGGGATAFSRKFSELIFPIPEQLPNEDSWTKLHIEVFSSGVAWNDCVVSCYRIHDGNSMAFGSSYGVKRDILDKRSEVYRLFLEKYESKLTQHWYARIKAQAVLNHLRSEGNVLGILLLRNVSFRQKSAAISYCKPFLYSVRTLLERHLLGR